MNLGITIARKGKDFTVLTTPEVPLNAQRRNFRVLRRELVKDGKPEYDEIQLWSSGGGRQKRAKLRADVAPLPPTAVKPKKVAPAVKPKKVAPAAPADVVPEVPAAPKSKPVAPKPPAPPKPKAPAVPKKRARR